MTAVLPVLRRSDRVVLEIANLRDELARVISIEELQESASRLNGFEAYAKAKGAKEITDKAVEARVWIEHRAGQLAIEAGMKPADMIRTHGIDANLAQRWYLLGATPPETTEAVIELIRAHRDLTMSGVARALRLIETPTRYAGVSELVDGRFKLRWKEDGRFFTSLCPVGTTLKQAAGTLARKKRAAHHGGRGVRIDGMGLAYQNVRKALACLDDSLGDLPPDARELAEAAMASLHAAEDKIGEARKANV